MCPGSLRWAQEQPKDTAAEVEVKSPLYKVGSLKSYFRVWMTSLRDIKWGLISKLLTSPFLQQQKPLRSFISNSISPAGLCFVFNLWVCLLFSQEYADHLTMIHGRGQSSGFWFFLKWCDNIAPLQSGQIQGRQQLTSLPLAKPRHFLCHLLTLPIPYDKLKKATLTT